MMENVGCKAMINGHVQGVGFRYFTLKEAQLLGLSGHAKNLSNGDVEVVLYGDTNKVNKMLKWLKIGPQTARVDNVLTCELPFVTKDQFNCN